MGATSAHVESGSRERRPAGPARAVVCRAAARGAEGDDAALVGPSVSLDAAAHFTKAGPVAAAAALPTRLVAVEDRAQGRQEACTKDAAFVGRRDISLRLRGAARASGMFGRRLLWSAPEGAA